jgi:DNA-binding IclR family transcriptional regulator
MENISATVNKAIDTLEIFLQNDRELRLSEVARLTGMDRATTYRMVGTLVKRRFLRQEKKHGKYSLGLKMIDCSFAVRRNLKFIDLAYLHLSKLNSAERVAVNLTVLDGRQSVVVEEIGISAKGLPMPLPAPKILPLHATACGKIFLAFMSKEKRQLLLPSLDLERYTPQTITSAAELEKELVKIKKAGVAFDLEDYKLGQRAAAAPVTDSNGIVFAAASLIIPAGRSDKEGLRYLASAIKRSAQELSEAVNQRDWI